MQLEAVQLVPTTYRNRPALKQASATVVTLAAVTVPVPLPLRIEQY
jgi:hypothetical protein